MSCLPLKIALRDIKDPFSNLVFQFLIMIACNLKLHVHYSSPSDGGVGGPVLLQQNAIFPQMMPKCLLVTMRPKYF